MHIGILFGWLVGWWDQLILVLSELGILVITAFAYRAWWSYSYPAMLIEHFNDSLTHLWQKQHFGVLSFRTILLYFLVPIWVLSVVILHIIFALGKLYKYLKHT